MVDRAPQYLQKFRFDVVSLFCFQMLSRLFFSEIVALFREAQRIKPARMGTSVMSSTGTLFIQGSQG